MCRSEQEVVHVAEAKPEQRKTEFLLQDILKFEGLVRDLTAADAPGQTPRALVPPAGGF